MSDNQAIDGVPRALLVNIEMTWRQASGFSNKANDVIAEGLGQLRALLAELPSEKPLPAAGPWIDGAPPKPWDSEPFLALTLSGDKLVLSPLPEEYSHDFTTADGTFMLRTGIKQWAQLSTSHYLDFDGKPEEPSPGSSDLVQLTAVARLRDNGDGGLEPDWLLEGGTAELWDGALLLVADNAPDLCADDGGAELYRAQSGGEA